jgi:hypothetical protein
MSDTKYEYFDLDAARIEAWMFDEARKIRDKTKANPTPEDWAPIQQEAQRRWEAVQKARDNNE